MLSVIIPVYCVPISLLKRSIDSVLAQTYKDLELILVDDGSPDACGNVCDEYAVLDQRVVVLHQMNGGVSSARNTGMAYATGDFFTFVDADDYIEKEYFEVLMTRTSDEVDLVVSGVTLEHLNKFEYMEIGERQTISPEVTMRWMLEGKYITWSPCAKIYKRSVLGKLRFDVSITMGEDLAFNWLVIKNISKAEYIPSCGYVYYQRENSAVHQRFRRKHLSIISAIEQVRCDIKNKVPSLFPIMTDVYAKTLGGWCYRIFRSSGTFDLISFSMLQKKLRPLFLHCLRRDFSFGMFIRVAVLGIMLPTNLFVLLRFICIREENNKVK